MAITLNQYYNEQIKTLGFNSWNHFCAQATQTEIDGLKKLFKKEFNLKLRNKEKVAQWRAQQKEKQNVSKKK